MKIKSSIKWSVAITACFFNFAYAGGWGDGGVVTTDLGSTEAASVAAVQSDGKVLIAGKSGSNMAVVRYNANGTLDDSFGSNGVVIVEYPLGWSSAKDMKILPDGKIIVMGSTYNTSTTDIALVKLNSNGMLDSSFAGGGMVRTDVGAFNNLAIQLAVQDDGKIIVLTTEEDNIYNSYDSPAIIRYNSDGTYDETFGVDGVNVYEKYSGYELQDPSGLAIESGTGKYVFDSKYNGDNGGRSLFYGRATYGETAYAGAGYEAYNNAGQNMLETSPSGIIAQAYKAYTAYVYLYIGGSDRSSYLLKTNGDGSAKKMTWLTDDRIILYDSSKITRYKYTGSSVDIDTTFGIGGDVTISLVPSDLTAYDSERVLILGTVGGDFYSAVYNADGSLYVDTPPVITSATSVTGEVDVALSYTILADNNPVSYSAENLPAGLSLDTYGDVPQIVGTPTESGTFVATIYASNSGGTGSADVTFVINKTSQTITFINPGAKRLGALPFKPDATASSGLDVTVAVDSGPATIIDGTLYLTGVGTVVLTASQAGSADYAAATDVSISFSVVYVGEVPSITSQPSDSTSSAGAYAVFSVSASGPAPYAYQWMMNGDAIADATGNSLILSGVSYFDEGNYSCLVSNSFGYVVSSNAILSVIEGVGSPDSDGDGLSDSLETYLSAFGFDPEVDSTAAWNRLQSMATKVGIGTGGLTAEEAMQYMVDLRTGSAAIEVSGGQATIRIHMETTTNLTSGVWTSITNVLEGIVPAEGNTRFFRFGVE